MGFKKLAIILSCTVLGFTSAAIASSVSTGSGGLVSQNGPCSVVNCSECTSLECHHENAALSDGNCKGASTKCVKVTRTDGSTAVYLANTCTSCTGGLKLVSFPFEHCTMPLDLSYDACVAPCALNQYRLAGGACTSCPDGGTRAAGSAETIYSCCVSKGIEITDTTGTYTFRLGNNEACCPYTW